MITPNDIIAANFHGLTEAPLTYLAVAYSYKHQDERIRKMVQQFRFEACTRAAGWLLSEKGWNVFSPITHSHPIHVLYPEVRGDWEFWKRIDTEFLQISTRMVVLTIPGWRKSTGVQAEIKIGARLGLDISFMHPIPEGGYLYTSSPQDDSYKVSVDLY